MLLKSAVMSYVSPKESQWKWRIVEMRWWAVLDCLVVYFQGIAV